MFGFIKRGKERRVVRKRSEETLKDIKKAKDVYLNEATISICHSFCRVNNIRYNSYDKIQQRIPEFKPETFNVDPKRLHDFWWPLRDRDSRIKAFDKLIEIYSK